MTIIVTKQILSGWLDNRPPMLEKDMYDSWKSRIEIYMMNRQHGRMILESIENGPLIWPSIEENGVTTPKKYSEPSATEAIQADCDIKAINIFIQGLPPEGGSLSALEELAFLADPGITEGQATQTVITHNAAYQANNLDAYNFDYDDVTTAKFPLTVNVISLVQDGSSLRLIISKFFYDHTTKQALGFQNPFYLKKAQQLEQKLYDGNVIKNTSTIVIPDSEETLMLAEESRSKMLLKQKDPMMLEKKVNTTPVNYAVLNQLSQDFGKRFVPQTELSVEQASCSQNYVNSQEPTLSSRPTVVEVPKELPKVSMVNTSLKKLEHQLAGFDVVVKERTTPTTITEGTWGDNSISNQSAQSVDQLFELNKLKAQSQEKDTIIKKLKERIQSLSGKVNEDKIKKDIEEIE
ncbi:hypothetical protein Tco_1049774, partial [Tanacetum coccineum]